MTKKQVTSRTASLSLIKVGDTVDMENLQGKNESMACFLTKNKKLSSTVTSGHQNY